MSSSIDLKPTLEEAFALGRREGLKEAFLEVRKMIASAPTDKVVVLYIDARLKSIHDFEAKNPFKQKDGQ